mmetsp:Transcript_17079/g.33312  ORF Transcript_17079/g.33312 Transcript_17079/m.33312 type:complete len:249 (-) Transcript_17079:45-791(-)
MRGFQSLVALPQVWRVSAQHSEVSDPSEGADGAQSLLIDNAEWSFPWGSGRSIRIARHECDEHVCRARVGSAARERDHPAMEVRVGKNLRIVLQVRLPLPLAPECLVPDKPKLHGLGRPLRPAAHDAVDHGPVVGSLPYEREEALGTNRSPFWVHLDREGALRRGAVDVARSDRRSLLSRARSFPADRQRFSGGGSLGAEEEQQRAEGQHLISREGNRSCRWFGCLVLLEMCGLPERGEEDRPMRASI